MKRSLIMSFLSVLLVLAEVVSAQEPPSSESPYTITITAPQTEFRVGTPVPLKLILTNTSKEPFLYGGGFINGPVYRHVPLRQIDIEVSDGEGKPVAETEYGKTVHGRSFEIPKPRIDPIGPGRPVVDPPEAHAVNALRSGATLAEESDLSKEFDLTKPGAYTVRARAHGNRKDRKTGQIIWSNKLTFTITK